MIRISPLAISALLPLVAAWSGSAQAATRGYGVTSFDRIRIAGPFDVHVHVGGSPSARATGTQDAIDRLSVEQQGTVLVIKPLPGGWGGWPGGSHGRLVVDMVAPALSNAAITGSGDVTIDRVKGDQLDLALSGSGSLAIAAVNVGGLSAVMTGSGNLSIAGHARQAKATLTGSGTLKGSDLVVDDAVVGLVGSGDLSIGAKHSAKVSLSGSGDVTISGPAACSVTRSGSGDVHCSRQAAD